MPLLTLTDAVTPQLLVHISAGSLAILTGAAALYVRKGARLHRLFGTVFLVSILAMSMMGAYLALLIPERATAVVGLFTFYFVATAWMTVKRREGTTGIFEVAACVFAFGAGAVLLAWGIMAATSPTGELDDIPPAPYWIAASFAIFVAGIDLKVLWQRGIAGAHRIARHLWRMCFALFLPAPTFSWAAESRPRIDPRLHVSVCAGNHCFRPDDLLADARIWTRRMAAILQQSGSPYRADLAVILVAVDLSDAIVK